MNNKILDVLAAVMETYGDGVFYNHLKTKNLMHDLAPELQKERIQAANFLEMNGYFQLKYAGNSYDLVRTRLIRNFAVTYAVSETVAAWVVDVFGALLGHNEVMAGAEYVTGAPPKGTVQSEFVKPAAGDNMIKNNHKPVTPPYPSVNYAVRVAADYHSAAVTKDGRVLAVGLNEDGQCNTFIWHNMVAVAAGAYFTVGLRSDGRVFATGRNDYGQCDVRDWTDVVAISAGARHTVGLRADGSVLAAGQNKDGECNVYNWRNIIKVTAGCRCTFGIKKDRKVLMKGGKSTDYTVSHLTGALDCVNAAPGRAAALLSNNTVTRIGGREDLSDKYFLKWKNLANWKDIIQLAAAPDYFAGLKSDGTVRLLAYFWEDTGVECGADDWRDIVAIAAGRYHILGVRRDGRVLAAMLHPDNTRDKGQCKVGSWNLFN